MRVDLLAEVPEPARTQVLGACRRHSFHRGATVFRAGDPADGLHLVEAGRLAVRTTTEGGDTVTLDVLGAGDVFGEMALVQPERTRSATVVALDEASTLVLGPADFRRLVVDHPTVWAAASALLATRVDRLTDQLIEALYVQVDRRVARRLCTLAALQGGLGAGLEIAVTQQELSDLVGATRPTVNQSLKKLEVQGAITITRGSVRIDDPVLLRRRTGLTG